MRNCILNESEREDVESIPKFLIKAIRDGQLNFEQIRDWIKGKEENVFVLHADSEIIINVISDDDLKWGHAEGEVRKPDVKHNVAILVFNTSVDWTNENYIPSHQVRLLLQLGKESSRLFSKPKRTNNYFLFSLSDKRSVHFFAIKSNFMNMLYLV